MRDMLRTLIRHRAARLAAGAALLLSVAGTSLAAAAEGDTQETPPVTEDTVVADVVVTEDPPPPPPAVDYRPDEGAIVFSLPDENGEFADCSTAVLTPQPDGSITVDPPECMAAPAVGPNGQVNHGQIVKAYVHALKDSGYEGSRGQLVRQAAQSQLGKGDQQVKASSDDVESTTEESGVASADTDSSQTKSQGQGHGHGQGHGRS